MEKWRRKVAFMRFFSMLPAGDRLLDAFRYHFGGLRKHNLDTRWYSIVEMLRMVRQSRIPIEGKDLAEVGTGWHPLLAPMFYGMGAKSIRMTDISPHAKTEFVDVTVGYLIKRSQEIAEISGVPAEILEKRWREILPNGRPWEPIFREHGISYHAPLDFSQTDWPGESLDFVFSNSCFCYIPEPILRGIFAESYRLLRRGGFTAHNIDPVDVLTGTVNFLRFSQEEWERIGTSKLLYQNRLRPARYVEIAKEVGFQVTCEERLPFPKPLKVERTELHEEFRDLPETELTCFHFLIAAKKP
jgi:hypothetical protein